MGIVIREERAKINAEIGRSILIGRAGDIEV